MDELESLLDKLYIFERLYDVLRVIDPVRKHVLKLHNGQLLKEEHACYYFFKKNTVCENCISIRALNDNNAVYKIESKEGKIYMITAVPVVIMEKRLVVELIKETTDNLLYSDGLHGSQVKVFTMIEEMNRAAVKDALTGVYNRRYISERLPVELSNVTDSDKPLSVIFADIDYFKHVNDDYGHVIGDMVLKEVAKELEQHIRKDDGWVARYGGEEFMLCLSNTGKNTAMKIAERIRESIENREFLAGDKTFQITCSFGVHTVHNTDNLTADQIIELADRRLYEAKSEGRNKVR